MFDSSSQLLIDNVAPQSQSSSDSFSTKKPANTMGEPGFSNAMNKAEQQSDANYDRNKQESQSQQANSQIKKPESSQTKNDDGQNQSDAKPTENTVTKKVESKQKPAKQEADQSSTTASKEQEAEVDVKQAPKTAGFNPLLLVKSEKSETSVIKTDVSDEGDNKKASLQDMVAKILQGRNEKRQGEKTAEEGDPLAKLNISSDKTAAYVKSVVSDLRDSIQKQGSVAKQATLSKQDALAKGEENTMKHALNIEEDIELEDAKVDEFVSKVFERLNMNKSNLEALITAKTGQEKLQAGNELIDQLSQKSMAMVADRVSTMSTSINAVGQRSNVLMPTQQFTMNTHINQPEWGNEFGKRIQFMMNNNIQTAELRLDPPELGRINVKINMTSDQANISFTSAHQNVRENIESTLPRLRELLAESGLQLGNADVSSQSQQQAKDEKQAESSMSGPVLPNMDDDLELEVVNTPKVHYSADGMIDYFA